MTREPCFECGAPSVEDHYVIPESRGGTQTVPLCGHCHGLVHDITRTDDIRRLTRDALAAKKAAGVQLGRPRTLDPAIRARIVAERTAGRSLRAIAADLTAEAVPTARGGSQWHASSIRQIAAAA